MEDRGSKDTDSIGPYERGGPKGVNEYPTGTESKYGHPHQPVVPSETPGRQGSGPTVVSQECPSEDLPDTPPHNPRNRHPFGTGRRTARSLVGGVGGSTVWGSLLDTLDGVRRVRPSALHTGARDNGPHPPWTDDGSQGSFGGRVGDNTDRAPPPPFSIRIRGAPGRRVRGPGTLRRRDGNRIGSPGSYPVTVEREGWV